MRRRPLVAGLQRSPVGDAAAGGAEVEAERLAADVGRGRAGDVDAFAFVVVGPERAVAPAGGAVAGRGRLRQAIEPPPDGAAEAGAFDRHRPVYTPPIRRCAAGPDRRAAAAESAQGGVRHEGRQVVHAHGVPGVDAAEDLRPAGHGDRSGRPVQGLRPEMDRRTLVGRRLAGNGRLVHRRLQECADLQPYAGGAAGLDGDRRDEPILGADLPGLPDHPGELTRPSSIATSPG